MRPPAKSPVRSRKVAEMKAKIAAGTAELVFKIDTVVDWLLDNLRLGIGSEDTYHAQPAQVEQKKE